MGSSRLRELLGQLLFVTYLRLPRWARPPAIGALVGLLLILPELLMGQPKLGRVGGELGSELALCAGLGLGGGALCGFAFSATRPLRAHLGRAGDMLSGAAMLWSYLGPLLLAGPNWLPRVPGDQQGLRILGVMVTVIGLIGGFFWFRGEGFSVGAAKRRAPELVMFARELPEGGEAWVLAVGGWIERGDAAQLLALTQGVLQAPPDAGLLLRLELGLAHAKRGDRLALELRAAVPVPVHLSPTLPGYVAFEVLLEGGLIERGKVLAEKLDALLVDPLTHAA